MDIRMLAFTARLNEIFSYEIIKGNALWRFFIVLVIIFLSLAIGKIVQYIMNRFALKTKDGSAPRVVTLIINAMAKPAHVFVFAIGFSICKFFFVFDIPETTELVEGISKGIETGWGKVAQALFSIAIAYGLFHFVDVIEYYLRKAVSKTDNQMDDMLVPVIRKSLRITITIIAVLFIAENVLGANEVKSLIVSAGVGGIAIALAAKDTLANFFGSVTIFADRPFHINELVKMDGYLGTIEEVGFRSSKIRTLDGHLVTVPNSTIANSYIENISRRPFVRRTSNITITYDAGHEKAEKAVAIIKDILAQTPEVNTSSDYVPRVYFDEFNDCSLNVYMTYWVAPADWWVYKEVNQRVNLEMMRRFEAAGIDFAFPTQTLYLRNEGDVS